MAENYDILMRTMDRDCRVLESFSIMDFSLLIGVHYIDHGLRERREQFEVRREGEGHCISSAYHTHTSHPPITSTHHIPHHTTHHIPHPPITPHHHPHTLHAPHHHPHHHITPFHTLITPHPSCACRRGCLPLM